MGLFDLEEHFAFYGAYHSNPINIVVHMIFVWPILFTALVLLYFTPALLTIELLNQSFLVLNYGFLFTVIYGLYYVGLDRKAGSLAALLCFICWVGGSALAHRLGFSLAWKTGFRLLHLEIRHLTSIWTLGRTLLRDVTLKSKFGSTVVLASQLVCWTGQFIGHGVFEKRAPALLDNLVQAFLMAPFFVLLEGLQSAFGYEPYPGFHANVKAKVDSQIKAWKDKKIT